MAIFTQLDSNNIVINLIPVSDADSPTEQDGINFCTQTFGVGNYVETYPIGNKRRRYARIGDMYDPKTDAFYGQNIIQNYKNQTRYINLPNGDSFCVLYRCASSLFTGLIAQTYFGKAGNGQSVSNIHGLPMTPTPTGTPYAIIREPVSRFISAYALGTGGVPAWYPVGDFIDWLIQQDQTKLNPHFVSQTRLLGDTIPENIVFQDFAKDLTPLAVTLGLPIPLKKKNGTKPEKKPTLTPEQIAKLQDFYSDDVALYAKVQAQPWIIPPLQVLTEQHQQVL